MKILLLTQWFDPEPTFKGLAFAKQLKKQGHDVQVITGFPNYPGGKIYEGYKLKIYQKEQIDGISILRVPLYPSHNSSAIGRIFNYISFAFMAIIFGIFFTKKSDVMYAYHPPLTVGLAAIIIKFFRRIPVVYDIQDMWPDTLKSTGMISNEKVLNIVEQVCKIVYKYVNHIVVLSPGFKNLLIKRGVPENKISVIYNWCDENNLDSNLPIDAKFKELLKGKFNIIFAGNMGKAQGLTSLIQVAKNISKINSNIQFVMIGRGTEVELLIKMVENEGLNNVQFIPQQPMNKIGSFLKEADVLLIHLKKDPLFEITIPSKTQAYMSIGKAIIMGVEGDAADLIESSKCGVVVEPENISEIENAVMNIYSLSEQEKNKLAQNAKEFYFNHLSLKAGVSEFIKVFKMVSIK